MRTTGQGSPADTVRKSGSTQPTPHGSQSPPTGSKGAVDAVRGKDTPTIKKSDPGATKGT